METIIPPSITKFLVIWNPRWVYYQSFQSNRSFWTLSSFCTRLWHDGREIWSYPNAPNRARAWTATPNLIRTLARSLSNVARRFEESAWEIAGDRLRHLSAHKLPKWTVTADRTFKQSVNSYWTKSRPSLLSLLPRNIQSSPSANSWRGILWTKYVSYLHWWNESYLAQKEICSVHPDDFRVRRERWRASERSWIKCGMFGDEVFAMSHSDSIWWPSSALSLWPRFALCNVWSGVHARVGENGKASISCEKRLSDDEQIRFSESDVCLPLKKWLTVEGVWHILSILNGRTIERSFWNTLNLWSSERTIFDVQSNGVVMNW
jgi:hypothetical protein